MTNELSALGIAAFVLLAAAPAMARPPVTPVTCDRLIREARSIATTHEFNMITLYPERVKKSDAELARAWMSSIDQDDAACKLHALKAIHYIRGPSAT